jgi:hypothetical protein
MQGNYHKPFPPPPSTIIQVVIFWLLVVNLIMFHPTKVPSTLIWVIVNHVDLHHKSMFYFLICKCDMLLGFAKGLKFPFMICQNLLIMWIYIKSMCYFSFGLWMWYVLGICKGIKISFLICKGGKFFGFAKGLCILICIIKVTQALHLQVVMVFFLICRGSKFYGFANVHVVFYLTKAIIAFKLQILINTPLGFTKDIRGKRTINS